MNNKIQFKVSTATTIKVPTMDSVTPQNQEIFKNLNSALGFVPNLYATFAHSKNALGNFLTYANGETSFSKKEKEVIDLAISQVNECRYCQSAHTALAKMNGFTDEQVIELRQGRASFDSKLDALAQISRAIAQTNGKVSEELKENFFKAGYNKENLVDLITAAGAITVTNILHNLTDVAIDFPVAPELETIHN